MHQPVEKRNSYNFYVLFEKIEMVKNILFDYNIVIEKRVIQ